MNWLRTTGLRFLLALGLGFALWGYVSYRENPERSASFDNIPVNVTGISPGLVVVDNSGIRSIPEPVDVTVEADADTLENVSAVNLEAFVDLTGRGQGEYVVPVNIQSTRSDLRPLTFSSEPDFLRIRLEQLITRTVPLTVEVTGNVPFSFERRPARMESQGQPLRTVQITGPQSLVERVEQARTTANIDGLTANYESPRPVEPIAADGQAVVGVTVQPVTVDILVPIVSSAGIKRVPVVPHVAGEPAAGQVVADVTVDPAFVTLIGSSGSLDEIQSIGTQNVDISGSEGVITRTVALENLPGASLQAGEPESVVVTVRIEPIARPFRVTLPVQVVWVNPPDGLLVSLSPQIVQVELSGTAAQLAALDPRTLQGTVDLEGRNAGTYALEPTFRLPEGVTLTNEPRVTVSLRFPPTTIPTPEPTQPPADTGPTPATSPEPTADTPPAGAPATSVPATSAAPATVTTGPTS